MEKKTKKILDAIFHTNVRDLLDKANSLGVNKENFVSIFEHEGLSFLIFERTVTIEPENTKESE